MDLVMERVEPSSGVGLGRPVERSLQITDLVLLGGTSHDGHSPVLPCARRADEAAALPSPRVLLSRRLKRYYGRLRLPPDAPPLPGSSPVIGRARSGGTSRSRRAGEGLPSSRRHPLSVPRPYAGRSLGAAIQALHPFRGLRRDNRGSAPPRSRPQAGATDDAAGFASRYGPLSRSPQRGFRRWASTRPVSRPSRQPATGPPGSYPDRTPTGRRRRAYVGSGHLKRPPPTLGAHWFVAETVARPESRKHGKRA
jgi:hypothetical protein